jgi:hypothetical protein
MRKLLSRKFLLALAVLVLKTLGVEIPTEIAGVVGAYILGESYVDSKR